MSFGGWAAVICVAFFAMLAVMSVAQTDKDAQRQNYEIECVKADGKIEVIFGNSHCLHK